MLPEWRGEVTVRQSETGRDGCARPDAVFDWMQEAASFSASSLGCGIEDLRANSCLWILSRIHVQFTGRIHSGERILVETCPSGAEGVFVLREYRLTDCATGEVRGTASSGWLLLDGVKYRPKRPCDTFPFLRDEEHELPRFFPLPGKILREPVQDPMTVSVRESMIDINRHLNNARIMGLVSDWLASRLGGPASLAEIQLNYIASVPPGSTLVLSGTLHEGAFYVEAVSPGETPVLYFQAKGTLAGQA